MTHGECCAPHGDERCTQRKQTGEVQREVTDKTVGSSFGCLGICCWRGLPEIFPTIVLNEPFPTPPLLDNPVMSLFDPQKCAA